jgi:hypothetical protein
MERRPEKGGTSFSIRRVFPFSFRSIPFLPSPTATTQVDNDRHSDDSEGRFDFDRRFFPPSRSALPSLLLLPPSCTYPSSSPSLFRRFSPTGVPPFAQSIVFGAVTTLVQLPHLSLSSSPSASDDVGHELHYEG